MELEFRFIAYSAFISEGNALRLSERVSNEARIERIAQNAAKGVINRKKYQH